MSGKWDVIIVGAGVGGLTAAAVLVKAGLRVLVLERNPHPGGTAYVYKRKGFTFPMGPLGFATPSMVKETLRELDGGDLKLSQIQYQIKAFDLDIPLSLPFPRMAEKLAGLFTEEGQAVEKIFRDMERIVSAMHLPEVNTNRLILEEASKKSALEYLSGLVKDWRLRRVLGSLGTQEPYSSLSLLAAMWHLISNEGIWYPTGGMCLLCDRIVDAVSSHRGKPGGFGEIKLGIEVEEIRIDKGNALGVTLMDGVKMDSAAVISNADYKNSFLKLIDTKSIPGEWVQAVAKAKLTRSNLQVCLGVDANRVDLFSFKEVDRLIYRRSQGGSPQEIDWNRAEIYPDHLAGQELEVSLLSKKDKALCPSGTEVIVIRTEAEHSHFTRFRPVWRKRVLEYQNYKMRLGRALIQEIEKFIPGLKEAICLMDVATPLTFEEQGGRSGGAVASWSWNYEDRPDYCARELVRTPIQGLYMAGYQAFSALFMGGFPTAMESGKRAAQAVLQGAGPIENIMIPVTE